MHCTDTQLCIWFDDNDCVDVENDKHDDVKITDNETESDEEMSEHDSAESSSYDDELANDRKESLAEALNPTQVENADDASWGSDSPLMRSNVSESKHDGNGNAMLVETDSHDTADKNNDDDDER
jgi:hypothetical protein